MFDQLEMPNSGSSFLKRLHKKLRSDDLKLPVYFGSGLIALFLITSSLAPEIDRRLGQLSVRKETQQTFAQELETQIKTFNGQLINPARTQTGLFSKQQTQLTPRQIAAARKGLMLILAQENPQKIFDLKIPANIRAKLPQDVQPYVEQDTTVQGTLKVLHSDDFENRISKTRYYLESGEKMYSLHTQDSFPQVLSGSLVRVSGVSIDNKLVFNMKGTLKVIQAAAAPNALGDQRLAVILVNFQDNTAQPVTKAQVQNVLSTEVDPYYKEASYNKFSIPADVFGWYTLPITYQCEPEHFGLILAEAIKAADPDINFQNYKHIIYAVPSSSDICGYGGIAGGQGSILTNDGTITVTHAWMYTSSAGNIAHITAHELGHNLGGIGEAHALDCGSSVIKTPIFEGGNCTHIFYGDLFDVMGSARLGHFNAYHKETLGWFDPGNIITVTASGTYTIEPLETVGSGAKIIKVPWDKNGSGQPVGWLYLEFRQLIGFDAKESWLIGNPNPTNGVLIHYSYPITSPIDPNMILGYYSYLLDATPQSQANEFFDPSDAALEVGKTFSDSTKEINITVISKTSQSITVQISLNAPTPTPTPTPTPSPTPTPTSTPAPTPSPAPGDSDGDGFTNDVELYVGTDPNKACGVSAWPPDINNDGVVNSGDLVLLAKVFGSQEGPPPVGSYMSRRDLNADGVIGSGDLVIFSKYFGKSCR